MAKQMDYLMWRDQQQQQGLLVGKRDALLTVLRARFDPVPEEWTRRIEAIDALAVLDALRVKAARAASLDDLRPALPD